jgi:DNA invertase Pin-like site-specific DNA recombinase
VGPALGEELRALGVEFVVLDQAVDTTTSGGRALFGMLAVFAEFERDLIIDRVRAGLARARAQGKRLGRPRIHHVDIAKAVALRAQGTRGARRRGSWVCTPWPSGGH